MSITNQQQCPSQKELARLLTDTGSIDAALTDHIDQCQSCQSRLENLSDSNLLETYRLAIQKSQDVSGAFEDAQQPGDLGSIDGIRIESRVGTGGMGIVFRGFDETLNRNVAVKVLSRTRGQESYQRFDREAKAAAKVDHPNVVPVFATGLARDGRPYLVMPFIEGESLADRLQRDRLLVRESAVLIREVALGLAEVHKNNLIHRDVKPANILLDRKQKIARLTDFGLVRTDGESNLTQQGIICGTPDYMSPGQSDGDDIQDPRNDIYSLGVVLYECLTGSKPFRGRPLEILEQHREHEPTPPSYLDHNVPRDLETICLKALEKEPGRRYQSADEFAADLLNYLEGKPVSAVRTGTLNKLWKWVKRRPAIAAGVSLFAILLVTATVVTTILWRNSSENAKLANQRNQSLLVTQNSLRENQKQLSAALRDAYMPQLKGSYAATSLPTAVRDRMLTEMVKNWRLLYSLDKKNPEALQLMLVDLVEVTEIALDGQFLIPAKSSSLLATEVADQLVKLSDDPNPEITLLASKAYVQFAQANINGEIEPVEEALEEALRFTKLSENGSANGTAEYQRAVIQKFEIQRIMMRRVESREDQQALSKMKGLLDQVSQLVPTTNTEPEAVSLAIEWVQLKQRIILSLAQMTGGEEQIAYRESRDQVLQDVKKLSPKELRVQTHIDRSIAVNRVYWAMALDRIGAHEKSMEVYLDAQALLKYVVKMSPLTGQFRADAFEADVLIAAKQWKEGDRESAIKTYRDALLFSDLTLQFNSQDSQLHRRVAQVSDTFGQCLLAMDRKSEAAEVFLDGAQVADGAAEMPNSGERAANRALSNQLYRKAAEAFEETGQTDKGKEARARIQ